jgi:hypothetical protein
VVCRTIAFDSDEVSTGLLGINDGQIDKKARLTDLLLHEVSVLDQSSRNLLLEYTVELSVRRSAHVQVARAGISKEPLECGDPFSMCPFKINVLVRYRTEYFAPTFCSGDQHIEPALAAIGTQSREAHAHALPYSGFRP